jgi:small subunit ribosomal protein S21
VRRLEKTGFCPKPFERGCRGEFQCPIQEAGLLAVLRFCGGFISVDDPPAPVPVCQALVVRCFVGQALVGLPAWRDLFDVFPGNGFQEKETWVVRLRLRDNESVQEAVRRFRKLVEHTGVKKEMRRREYFEKPSEQKRRERRRAQRRARINNDLAKKS